MPIELWIVIVASTFAFLGGIIGVYYKWRSSRPTRTSVLMDYQELLVGAVADQKALTKDVSALKCQQTINIKEIDTLKKTVRDYRRGVDRLVAQLKEHSIVPVWSPSPYDD